MMCIGNSFMRNDSHTDYYIFRNKYITLRHSTFYKIQVFLRALVLHYLRFIKCYTTSLTDHSININI